MLATKTGPYTLTDENGDAWQIADDGRPVGTVYNIDDNGHAVPVPVQAGAFDRIREWNMDRLEKKSDRLNAKAADGGALATFRAQRVDKKIDRKKDRQDGDEPSVPSTAQELKMGVRAAWSENYDTTNPSSSAALTTSISRLLEVDDFEARILNNASSSGCRIYRLWSGSTLIRTFGDSGTDMSLFSAGNNYTSAMAPVKLRGGKTVKFDVSIPASGSIGIILDGSAVGVGQTC